MNEIYLEKEGCGIQIVYDHGELDRHIKMGWKKVPDDWHRKVHEKGRDTRLRILREQQIQAAAELARLEAIEAAETVETVEVKRGRPRKVEA